MTDHYDDYVKIKDKNKKLKKDLENASTLNIIIIETQDDKYNMTLEIDALREENKKFKYEMGHLMSGFERFTKGHNF